MVLLIGRHHHTGRIARGSQTGQTARDTRYHHCTRGIRLADTLCDDGAPSVAHRASAARRKATRGWHRRTGEGARLLRRGWPTFTVSSRRRWHWPRNRRTRSFLRGHCMTDGNNTAHSSTKNGSWMHLANKSTGVPTNITTVQKTDRGPARLAGPCVILALSAASCQVTHVLTRIAVACWISTGNMNMCE